MPTNEERATRGLAARNTYIDATDDPGQSLQTALGDLLADLRHLAVDEEELNVDLAVSTSETHFNDETDEEENDVCGLCQGATGLISTFANPQPHVCVDCGGTGTLR